MSGLPHREGYVCISYKNLNNQYVNMKGDLVLCTQ